MAYEIVLFTGCTEGRIKTFGAYKCAHELRLAGFRTLVVNHLHDYDIDELRRILSRSITDETLFVGVSNTFLDSRLKVQDPLREVKTAIEYFLPQGEHAECAFVDHLHSLNQNCKLVVGGTRTFLNISNPRIDFAVIGYADRSVVNLARHIRDGVPLEKADKNSHGIVVINDPIAEDFDFPNSTMQWTDDDIVITGETLPLEISRGCVFSCSFCNYRLNGKKNVDYLKKYDLLRQELIHNYNQYNITYYRLLDDTYNDTKQKIDVMFDMVKSLPFKPRFWSYVRLDLLAKHPDTIDKLIDTGIVHMFFGIETFDKKAGRIIGKGYDPDQLIDTIRHIKDRYQDNVWLHGNFICGLPGESRFSIQSTMDKLNNGDIPLDSYHYTPLTIQRNEFQTWQSAFGLDMTRFGYRDIGWHGNNNYIQEVNWESDVMNYLEAKALCGQFKHNTVQPNRRSPADSPINWSPDYLKHYKLKLFKHLNSQQCHV